jgi:transposase InsO family protein
MERFGTGTRALLSTRVVIYREHGAKGLDRYFAVRPLVVEIADRSYRATGYRRVQSVLATKHGISLSGKTVLKLMKQENRQCNVRKRKYRSYKGQVGIAAPNILERNFRAESPNQKWATDVTEFKILGQNNISPRFWICSTVKFCLMRFAHHQHCRFSPQCWKGRLKG